MSLELTCLLPPSLLAALVSSSAWCRLTRPVSASLLFSSAQDIKRAEQQNKARLQETIVLLLKHISKSVDASQNLPSQDKLADMKADLSFKQAKLQNSQETMLVLQKGQ
jgi:hypothetical protein